MDLDDLEEDDATKSRKRAGTTSALNSALKGKKKTPSKSCGQARHNLSRCYYAFPELRHAGFKPVESLVAKSAETLQDLDLATEVDKIQKERAEKKAE